MFRQSGRGDSGLPKFSFEFLNSAPVGHARHRGHSMDQKTSIQMVELMLKGPGSQVFAGFLKYLAVRIRSPDGDNLASSDVTGDARQGQTALFLMLSALGRDY